MKRAAHEVSAEAEPNPLLTAYFVRGSLELWMPQEITPCELARRLINGHAVRLIDVRQPWENQQASLPDSILIPLDELPQRAEEVGRDSDTLVVVYCHHGIRSLSAVAYLERLGFHNVCSLAGGIDAWSCEVDPAIARY